jgi:hypothetical protein
VAAIRLPSCLLFVFDLSSWLIKGYELLLIYWKLKKYLIARAIVTDLATRSTLSETNSSSNNKYNGSNCHWRHLQIDQQIGLGGDKRCISQV